MPQTATSAAAATSAATDAALALRSGFIRAARLHYVRAGLHYAAAGRPKMAAACNRASLIMLRNTRLEIGQ